MQDLIASVKQHPRQWLFIVFGTALVMLIIVHGISVEIKIGSYPRSQK